jgi:hypothetical protein
MLKLDATSREGAGVMVRKAIFGAVIGLGLVLGPTVADSQTFPFGRTSVGTPFFESVQRNFLRSVNAPRAQQAATFNRNRVFQNLIGSGYFPTSPNKWFPNVN